MSSVSTKDQAGQSNSAFKRFGKDLVAGGASGIVSKTIGAPIERVKILLQTQHINTSLNLKYSGPVDCVKRILRDEGIWAFWRGNLANVYRYFPNQAMTFAFKDKFKEFLIVQKPSYWQNIVGNLASAGLAGGSAIFVSYPFELARTRLAVDVVSQDPTLPKRQFKGTFDCLKYTYQHDGIRGVYAGFGISLIGVIIFRALMLGGYDAVKYVYNLEKSSVTTRLIVAQTITTVVGTLTYPLDTIKRRMMIQKQSFMHEKQLLQHQNINKTSTIKKQGMVLYKNSFDCFMRILKEEGVKGLFRGLSANLVRGISGAFLLVGYDEMKKILQFI